MEESGFKQLPTRFSLLNHFTFPQIPVYGLRVLSRQFNNFRLPRAEEWDQERTTLLCPRLTVSDLNEQDTDLQSYLLKLRRNKMTLELPGRDDPF